MGGEVLFWRIYDLPRVRLITLPTPLEKLMRISEEYGVDIYVKRDDVMEPAFGGNKARKLEFIFGEVVRGKYDTVITRGAYYSNHVRLTSVFARKHGVEPYIITYPPKPGLKIVVQGNILLNKILGAQIIEARDAREADALMIELKEMLERKGRKPYLIPFGGSTPLAVPGYILAVYEMLDQFRMIGRKPKYIIHATGTGTTQAGILLGLKLLGVKDVEVIGVNVEKSDLEKSIRDKIIELVGETCKLLGLDRNIVDENEIIINNEYSFGGYGETTKDLIDFIKTIAVKEGLLLDPVYTGKAFYGLIDMIENRLIKRGETVAFIHTGGTPLIFQLAEKFLD